MPTIGDLISKLATISGVDPADDSLKNILSKAETATAPVPDDFYNKVMGSIFTLDSAKNNSDLHNYFYAKYADKTDQKLQAIMDATGLGETEAKEIITTPGIHNKIERLVDKVRVLTEKKHTAKSGDKKELEDEIKRLNDAIKATKDEAEARLSERDATWTDRIRQTENRRFLSSFNYGLDNLPKDVVIETAQNLVNKKLQEKKLRVDYNPNENTFKLVTDQNLEYYEANSPVSYQQFVEKTLGENHLLQVSGQGRQPANNGTATRPVQTVAGGKAVDTSKYEAAFAIATGDAPPQY